jgi:hypothetical protein
MIFAHARTGGYMLKGRVRMHTPDGHQDFAAGEAFYWAPGHPPEALEDSEYVDFCHPDDLRLRYPVDLATLVRRHPDASLAERLSTSAVPVASMNASRLRAQRFGAA